MSAPTGSRSSPSAIPPVSLTYKRKKQVNDPSPVMTPARSAPPPIISTYKRRRLLNSVANKGGGGLNKWRGNIALVDEEGVVQCGSVDGSREDIEHQNSQQNWRNCDFSPSVGHDLPEVDCMELQQQQQVPSHDQIGKAAKDDNDLSHGVNVEGSTDFDQAFTLKACSVGNGNKNKNLTRKDPRRHKYWPKINDKTKPKKVPKSKKVKPRNESGMPHVADHSVHGPQTPEPLGTTSSCTGKRSCRRALTFPNEVKDDVDAGNESGGKYKRIFNWSFNKDLEVHDFESCIGMRKIISEYKRGKHKSKKRSGIIIEDLKAALPLFSLSRKCSTPVKIPRRKRSKRNRPKRMLPVEVSNADNALIPYGGRVDLAQVRELAMQEREVDNALMPHGERLDSAQWHKYKVNVDICPNTIRVWNLLMENDGGLDETDEKTKEWLHEETKQLSERFDVFISCMNLIQGYRRCSHWGGSVLDSVIGVLLTQNVTDVLSSSAFMSLAAKYPSKHRRDRDKDSRGFSSSSCEVADKNFQSCSQGVESSSREKDELKDISRNGGRESSESTVQVTEDKKMKTTSYWYSLGKEISMAQAKRNGKTSKIANRKKEVMPELEGLSRKKKGEKVKIQDNGVNWDELKRTYCTMKPRSYDSLDVVDWDAVMRAPLEEVAKVIEGRGMNNLIAGRIKDLLDRMVRDHGSIDLEWLCDVPHTKAKDYLKSIDGIGLKSVECIRLLALDHHAFPVDTNVGRIAVRLGWVPLQPFPNGILIHLLENYPLLDKIQQYLWPRIQGLDKEKLFELHYHLITFGKVFCKKKRPNCNHCPMKGECKHFASAYASEKLSLPGPNKDARASDLCHNGYPTETPTPLPLEGSLSEPQHESVCEPIVEVPSTPEPQYVETSLRDIEDLCSESDDYIPTIVLNTEAFRKNLLMEIEKRNCMHHDISKALVAVTHESASIPMRKVSVLRTEHLGYELEDGHPLLAGFRKREPGDPCPYLVKVWTTGETVNSEPKIEEESDHTVLGTILIPCRTANRGSFPLSGTYFQTNEVFADDESSRNPISIPTNLLWNRTRRLLYCGTSVGSILSGVDLQKVTYCFWEGFICVRGFDKTTGAPRPLNHRFHKRSNKKKQDLEE